MIPGRNVSDVLEIVFRNYDRRIRPFYGGPYNISIFKITCFVLFCFVLFPKREKYHNLACGLTMTFIAFCSANTSFRFGNVDFVIWRDK